MYVGVQHTATQESTVDAQFACAACGYRSAVRIHAKGWGQGVAHYGIGNEAAYDAARLRAAQNVRKSATIIREALVCPRCRARTRDGDRTRLVWIVLPLAALGVCLSLVVGGGIVLALFADKLGALGSILAPATLLGMFGMFPSTILVLARTRPIVKLRRNAQQCAEFVVAT